MITLIVLGLSMGFIFGVALEKSRVFEPGVILRQFQLRNFLMIKVFMTAMATSLIVILIMHQFFDISFQLKPTYSSANILGGLLMGFGFVMAGACPGTVYAQMGVGYRDAILTFIGGLFGAAFFGLIKKPLLDGLFYNSDGVKIQLHQLLGMEYWSLAVVVFFLFVFALFILEKRQKWQDEVGMNCDGVS